MKIKILSLALIAILGTGCSGGGRGNSTSDTSSSDNSVNTGIFVDAPVQGLYYETATQSGYTDEEGHYKYKSGETVTFQIGNLTLGSVNAKKTITPLTLGGDSSLDEIGTKATNIARILQSLDDNPSDSLTITIPSSLKDLNVPDIDLLSDADLGTILARAQEKTSKTYILKNSIDAENTMKVFLQDYLYTGSYTATSIYSGESSLPASQCGGTLQWVLNIDSNGHVNGRSTTENRAVMGIQLKNSTISGIANDGTSWNATINEDGTFKGTYNYGSGQCVGTISGNKN